MTMDKKNYKAQHIFNILNVELAMGSRYSLNQAKTQSYRFYDTCIEQNSKMIIPCMGVSKPIVKLHNNLFAGTPN